MSHQLQKSASSEASGLGFLNRQFTKSKPLPAETKLDGKTAIVTGSNSGLGLSVSRQLLKLGLSRLVMAVRSLPKGEAAAAELRGKFPGAEISVWNLDMDSYDSIRAFARQCESLDRFDITVLNAGLMQRDFTVNPSTEHEVTLQVNYLSTALLTILLLPKLKASKRDSQPPVLTIVGSDMMYTAKFKTDQPILPQFQQDPNAFDGNTAYTKSKMLQVFFIAKLAEYVSSDDVLLNVSNPGLTMDTSFFEEQSLALRIFMHLLHRICARSLDVGTSAILDAVLAQGSKGHGSFLSDWTIKPYPEIFYTKSGDDFKERLWQETMDEFKPDDAWKIVNDIKTNTPAN